ncbi:exported hypothetical protein [Tenacibaculum litopenaei]|uniref:hypothetical protein n=1 Tax=Tenacibaculum litopenaei TaxID=396016 RepID=UPI003895A451
MKPIYYLCLIMISLCLFSCTTNNDFELLQNRELTTRDFFQKITEKEVQINTEHVYYISYHFDSVTQKIRLLEFEEKAPDFFLLESQEEVAARHRDDSYEIYLNISGTIRGSIGKTCNGKWSCADVINDFLKNNSNLRFRGTLVYAPQNRSFYLM